MKPYVALSIERGSQHLGVRLPFRSFFDSTGYMKAIIWRRDCLKNRLLVSSAFESHRSGHNKSTIVHGISIKFHWQIQLLTKTRIKTGAPKNQASFPRINIQQLQNSQTIHANSQLCKLIALYGQNKLTTKQVGESLC